MEHLIHYILFPKIFFHYNLILCMNASAEDPKNKSKGSHDLTNYQPNFTEVCINSRSAEPKRDTENGRATSGGQRGAPGG